MSRVESAISWAEAIARDDTHGYSQYSRWGDPDFDCSSLVVSAYQQAGVPVRDNGATYTGNMYTVFCRTGFKDVTASVNIATGAGLKRGDVLLRDGHTAMYCGNGREVEAACDEYGGIRGANPGDQTGYEILIQQYIPNWSIVLRYNEKDDVFMIECKTIWKGCTGNDVKRMQALLRGRGYRDPDGKVLKIDGIFGDASEYALINFQNKYNLEPDAICGRDTWKKLIYG